MVKIRFFLQNNDNLCCGPSLLICGLIKCPDVRAARDLKSIKISGISAKLLNLIEHVFTLLRLK